MKGIDNAAYYRLVPDAPQFYYDTTGTGNSLNVTDDSLLLLFNGHHDDIDWTLPKQWGEWRGLIADTAAAER
jgi:pullulanase/glycogen debranching enzyme